jgi:hypothetical protein
MKIRKLRTKQFYNIGIQDAGFYECQVSTEPVSAYHIHLNVVGKNFFPYFLCKDMTCRCTKCFRKHLDKNSL